MMLNLGLCLSALMISVMGTYRDFGFDNEADYRHAMAAARRQARSHELCKRNNDAVRALNIRIAKEKAEEEAEKLQSAIANSMGDNPLGQASLDSEEELDLRRAIEMSMAKSPGQPSQVGEPSPVGSDLSDDLSSEEEKMRFDHVPRNFDERQQRRLAIRKQRLEEQEAKANGVTVEQYRAFFMAMPEEPVGTPVDTKPVGKPVPKIVLVPAPQVAELDDTLRRFISEQQEFMSELLVSLDKTNDASMQVKPKSIREKIQKKQNRIYLVRMERAANPKADEWFGKLDTLYNDCTIELKQLESLKFFDNGARKVDRMRELHSDATKLLKHKPVQKQSRIHYRNDGEDEDEKKMNSDPKDCDDYGFSFFE